MMAQIAILVLTGLVIGVLSGLLGIGGGTLMVPLLRLGFNCEPLTATATSLFTILFTSVSGTATHVHNKTCIPKLGVILGISGALTSALGVYLGTISPGWLVMLAAAIVVLYGALSMFSKALKATKASPSQTAERAEETPFELNARNTGVSVLIGLIAGLISGYVGVGGGFIMVPLMLGFLGVSMRKASGTSLIAILILALPSVAENLVLGNVDLLAGICLAVGSIPGAVLGARLVKRVPEAQLRFVFAFFLLVAAAALVLREVM